MTTSRSRARRSPPGFAGSSHFIPSKRLIVSELPQYTVPGSPTVHRKRARALAAGRPLLTAAQDAHEIRDDLTLEQIFARSSPSPRSTATPTTSSRCSRRCSTASAHQPTTTLDCC